MGLSQHALTHARRLRPATTVKGYKAQSALVMAQLERLLSGVEARGESAIVEGVHLSLNLVMPLVEKHPSMLPFLITIRCV